MKSGDRGNVLRDVPLLPTESYAQRHISSTFYVSLLSCMPFHFIHHPISSIDPSHFHNLNIPKKIISQTGVPLPYGSLLIAAITSICSFGFLLFGYDQGIMPGIVISDYWLSAMSSPSIFTIGTITALYDDGAFLGVFPRLSLPKGANALCYQDRVL